MTLSEQVLRFAPTPSGHLHVGNLFNLFFCEWFSIQEHAKLLIRIDDIDQDRCKKMFSDSILETLKVLEVEFDKVIFQSERQSQYQKALEENQEKVFLCECTRKELASFKEYPGTCLSKKFEQRPLKPCYRLAQSPYPIVFRRDQIFAYHWASIWDDCWDKVDILIRGDDLRESSFIQRSMTSFLGVPLPSQRFFHPLMLKDNGEKFSKSRGDGSQLTKKEMAECWKKFLKENSFESSGVPMKERKDFFQKNPFPLRNEDVPSNGESRFEMSSKEGPKDK